MNIKRKCPKCRQPIIGYPALSRKDNKTKICSTCGNIEAIEEFIKYQERSKSNEDNPRPNRKN